MGADYSAPMIVQARTKGLAAGPAVSAHSATDIVADDDTLTGSDPFHSLPQRRHFTCRPVSHDSGKIDLEGPAAANFHLKEVHADRANTKQYFTCLWLRRRHCLAPQILWRPELS
jgi:hypothetical protein